MLLYYYFVKRVTKKWQMSWQASHFISFYSSFNNFNIVIFYALPTARTPWWCWNPNLKGEGYDPEGLADISVSENHYWVGHFLA